MSEPRKAFVVHGRDNRAKAETESLLYRLGVLPVVLHRLENRGRTIIEKFEAEGDVSFAVVLLTPDDEVKSQTDGASRFRARQNVVFELGYFFARLGRDRVICISRRDVEKPSDIDGVLYLQFADSVDEVESDLRREVGALVNQPATRPGIRSVPSHLILPQPEYDEVQDSVQDLLAGRCEMMQTIARVSRCGPRALVPVLELEAVLYLGPKLVSPDQIRMIVGVCNTLIMRFPEGAAEIFYHYIRASLLRLAEATAPDEREYLDSQIYARGSALTNCHDHALPWLEKLESEFRPLHPRLAVARERVLAYIAGKAE